MIQLGSLLIQPILTRDRVIYTKMDFGGGGGHRDLGLG